MGVRACQRRLKAYCAPRSCLCRPWCCTRRMRARLTRSCHIFHRSSCSRTRPTSRRVQYHHRCWHAHAHHARGGTLCRPCSRPRCHSGALELVPPHGAARSPASTCFPCAHRRSDPCLGSYATCRRRRQPSPNRSPSCSTTRPALHVDTSQARRSAVPVLCPSWLAHTGRPRVPLQATDRWSSCTASYPAARRGACEWPTATCEPSHLCAPRRARGAAGEPCRVCGLLPASTGHRPA